MIEVILLERIERLGQMGQTVKVRPGFARNFLLPLNKALRATKANLEQFEKQRTQLEAKNAAERAEAETLGAKLDGLKLVVVRQASETGHLYGSVTSRDVADAAKDSKKQIERAQVQIDQPIKTLGLFPVKVKLHPEVTIKIIVNVARSEEEAKVQAEKGAAVAKANAEKEAVVAAFEGEQPAGEADAKPKKAAKKKTAAADEAEDEKPKAKKPRAKKTAEG
jgi:large subunit ribosomal protein L9